MSKTKGGKKIIKLAVKKVEYEKQDGSTGKYEIGFFKDPLNWIIKFDRKKTYYYSRFESFIEDAFQMAFKVGINRMGLEHIKQVHQQSLRVIENTTRFAGDEIKRLEKENAELKNENYLLADKFNKLKKCNALLEKRVSDLTVASLVKKDKVTNTKTMKMKRNFTKSYTNRLRFLSDGIFTVKIIKT